MFRWILNDPAFRAGDLHTGYLDELLKRGLEPEVPSSELVGVAALVASQTLPRGEAANSNTDSDRSRWLARRTRGVAAVKRVIRIDGEPVEPSFADVVETEPGVWSVLKDGASYEVRVSGEEIVPANRHRFVFKIHDPRQWERSSHAADAQGQAVIKAVMPGKIVRVLVAEGDEVSAGQGLIVIEAMKMQNELKAPRDGRVAAIEVKEHDSVNAGARLLTIE